MIEIQIRQGEKSSREIYEMYDTSELVNLNRVLNNVQSGLTDKRKVELKN